jgi:L-amino acid N-acyltransferase YncA
VIGGTGLDANYYRMKPGQEGEVAELILGLIADYGTDFQSKLTAQSLAESGGFLNVEVAERDGRIMGICAWVMSFSTWRGVKGMHVADHFVLREFGKTGVPRGLLRFAAVNAAAQGAKFIRTEVDISEEASEELFRTVGFWYQTRHALHFLEPDKFEAFVAEA